MARMGVTGEGSHACQMILNETTYFKISLKNRFFIAISYRCDESGLHKGPTIKFRLVLSCVRFVSYLWFDAVLF